MSLFLSIHLLMLSSFTHPRFSRRSSFNAHPSFKPTVLLVDNQAVARMGVRSILSSNDCISVVGEASDGIEAVRAAKEHKPDLILLEPEIPRISGASLVEALLEATPDTQILILSAYDSDELLQQLVDGRIAGYLSKRDTPERILRAVQEIGMGAADWVSPCISQRLMQIQRQASSLSQLHLTDREMDTLQVLSEGATNGEIANRLCVSIGTVKNHLTSIYEKLDVDSRAEAIVWMHKNHVVIE